MLPILFGLVAGGLIVKNMTGYPSEIRNLRKQMPKEEQETFIQDYKNLPNETKTQFKKYLRDANMVEASKLIGRDLTNYKVQAKEQSKEEGKDPTVVEDNAAVSDNGFSLRIKNILGTYQLESDPSLVAEAAKAYDSIAGFSQMNIVDKTRKMLDVSQ